ncbi:MAG: branched-chain amino acid ABC transporter permease [Lachnospiraceae bacterium]|nr:branched-chain amino acid ABC transporter permease [Lachnospiraceae bacterium]
MVITTQTIITSAAVLTALVSIFTIVFKVHSWYLKQEQQDSKIDRLKDTHNEDVHEIKAEQRIICEGLLACLDGLQQLGCNHSVPEAKKSLENHLNKIAHD